MTVVEKIDAILQNRNMSRRQLAKAANIPPSSLQSAMERGKNISTNMLEKISDALNVSILDLIDRTEVSPLDLLLLPQNDIEAKLDEILTLLKSTQESPTVDGEPLDEATKELMLISLRNSWQLLQFAKKHLLYKKYEAATGPDEKPDKE